MDFARLRSVTPLSRGFGCDRGRPIDRHYIEGFLALHAADVHGRVLEFGDDAYTRRFGADRLTQSDVLHAAKGNPRATIVADIQHPNALDVAKFDCIICTQVLMYVYDTRAALRTLHRALAPGGVLLATFPGISQLSPHDMEAWGEFWRFTSLSAACLFGETFGADNVCVETCGNVLTATAFLHGVTVEELTLEELDHRDRDYEVIVAVRAVKNGAPE
ncbi:MAG: class I SAM-dependent methyltransferase [Casimicrobiaceae bacterium]